MVVSIKKFLRKQSATIMQAYCSLISWMANTFSNAADDDDDDLTAPDGGPATASGNVRKDLSQWQERHATLLLSKVKVCITIKFFYMQTLISRSINPQILMHFSSCSCSRTMKNPIRISKSCWRTIDHSIVFPFSMWWWTYTEPRCYIRLMNGDC